MSTPAPDVSIRTAREDDAPGIARVHVESWRSTYRGLMPVGVLDGLSVERRTAAWREQLAPGQARPQITVVAAVASPSLAGSSRGEQIIGFASGGPEREGDARYTGEIYALYLLPEWQRRGVGRSLMRAIASALQASGHRSALVWVLAENPGRAFYAALGGHVLREKPIDIGGTTLREVAYAWDDIASLSR